MISPRRTVWKCSPTEHSIPSLPIGIAENARIMILQNFAVASKRQSFNLLSERALCKIVSSQMINASEDDVLSACLGWIANKYPPPDLKLQERVLQLVRLSQVSAKKLFEFKSNELMTRSAAVAHHYHCGVEWQMTLSAGRDKKELQKRLMLEKSEVFKPRGPPCHLQIYSHILDVAMAQTLASMFGRSMVATSIARGAPNMDLRGVSFDLPLLVIIKDSVDHVFGAYCHSDSQETFMFSLKESALKRW